MKPAFPIVALLMACQPGRPLRGGVDRNRRRVQ